MRHACSVVVALMLHSITSQAFIMHPFATAHLTAAMANVLDHEAATNMHAADRGAPVRTAYNYNALQRTVWERLVVIHAADARANC